MQFLKLFFLITFFSNFCISSKYSDFFLLEAPKDFPYKSWVENLKKNGIFLAHYIPPIGGILITDLNYFPDINQISKINGTKIYFELPTGEDEERIRSSVEGNILYNVFKNFLGYKEREEENFEEFGYPLIDDYFFPLIDIEKDLLVNCTPDSLRYVGSEYLLGNISVNVVLPESDGSTDPSTEDWTSTYETNVINEITEGLNELRNLYPLNATLKPNFTYHFYLGRTNPNAQTQYEPINRNANPSYSNCSVGEGLWACEILDKLGYSSTYGYLKAKEFNGDTRNSDGTDWAFTIFVINSVNDSDGRFPDGFFAYAWIGGPWLVMTYDNDGWGISNMNSVVRHETGHIFYALDEYSSSPCTCEEVSGYINYQNQNCQKSCSSNVACMMRGSANSTCYYTKGQMGWGDLDSDLIPDPVDISPETNLIPYTPDPTTNTILTYNGSAEIQKNTNNNIWGWHCDINILTISNVQYRINGGSWNNASPSDGSFDSAFENYTFTIGPLAPGTYTIETRAIDELDQADLTYASDTVTVLSSEPPGVQNGSTGIPMKAVKIDPSGSQISLTWDNSCGSSNYSIVVGPGSGLPSSYNGIYNVDSTKGYCSLGNGSSFTWTNTINPASDPKKFYWFLVVATDESQTVEGSWGKNAGSFERTGPSTAGSSGQCSITTKSLTNTCGQ